MSDVVELAWAAGFFDGEGTVSVNRPSPSRSGTGRRAKIAVRVSQCDRRPLERFHAVVGGKIYGPYQPRPGKAIKSRKPISYCEGSGQNAGPMLSRLWPYLSEPKKEQAKASFRRVKDHNLAVGPPRGPGPRTKEAMRAWEKYGVGAA